MTRQPPYWPHRCPACAAFVGQVSAYANDERITRVTGVCKRHGLVELTGESLVWDNYIWDESA